MNGETNVFEFETTVHGKWILLGEHAVLRGVPALAFPVFGKNLSLRWRSTGDLSSFHVDYRGDSGHEFQLLFSGVIDRALELVGRQHDFQLRSGVFEVESSLPVGAGLGASAALAVAVGRWFVFRGAIQPTRLFWFCREIENLFHGESSGVDIAVALEDRGLHFERNDQVMRGFDLIWEPYWYISSSGARGITSECVAKVKSWLAAHPREGELTDSRMHEAVQIAERALTKPAVEADDRLNWLKTAIDMGNSCFETWGLVDGELGRHLKWLKDSGALAVKPTGSGGGGFALSLWKERPSVDLERQLIPVFREAHS